MGVRFSVTLIFFSFSPNVHGLYLPMFCFSFVVSPSSSISDVCVSVVRLVSWSLGFHVTLLRFFFSLVLFLNVRGLYFFLRCLHRISLHFDSCVCLLVRYCVMAASFQLSFLLYFFSPSSISTDVCGLDLLTGLGLTLVFAPPR